MAGFALLRQAVAHDSANATDSGASVNRTLIGVDTSVREEAEVKELVKGIAEVAGAKIGVDPRDGSTEGGWAEQFVIDSQSAGTGYGEVDEETMEAVKLIARREGVVLDPVYTGKAMKGLIRRARNGELRKEEGNVLFVHTGGTQVLGGYEDVR